uniref:LysM peptidoglycan-binding domain-containing protein n=1 Tax=Flavobacterium sp. TaxID=239 RepID=UPI00404970C9
MNDHMKLQFTIGLIALFLNCTFAQEVEERVMLADTIKLTTLDSIKNLFVYHETAACVDNRWINTYLNDDLFEEMEADLELTDAQQDSIVYDLSTDLLKERLQYLDNKSAFNISYNPNLEKSIKYYLKNRKKSFERLIGMAEYYFPIFEESLAKYNVPLEIKYLAVVESALNPKAVSRMGATGLWQFMYATGKQYKLDINTFVDERSDLLKSTEAACQYMVNMYKIFGDWDMVLASYNAGPGNVSKAIRRSGGKQNYWNIRPYLPRETQGYVPAFLATMYVYEFHKEHGFEPQKFQYNPMLTDTIMVKDKITFKQLSDLLDVSLEELQFLNPSYKRDYVPFQNDKQHFLRLPLDKIAVMTSNEPLIYAYAKLDFDQMEQPISEMLVEDVQYYTVRKGDYLGRIAKKFRVSVNDIKRWNGLRSNNLSVGKKLRIESFKKVVNTKKEPVKKKSEEVVAQTKASEKAEKVAEETLNETEENTLEETGQEVENTASDTDGTNLNAIKHKIQSGESLISIAQQYKVSVADLQKWNQLENSAIKAGDYLEVFQSNPAEPESQKTNVTKTINKSGYKLYEVQKGDSLYSIAEKLEGVTVSDLKKWNALKNNNIKPGMKLIIHGS